MERASIVFSNKNNDGDWRENKVEGVQRVRMAGHPVWLLWTMEVIHGLALLISFLLLSFRR